MGKRDSLSLCGGSALECGEASIIGPLTLRFSGDPIGLDLVESFSLEYEDVDSEPITLMNGSVCFGAPRRRWIGEAVGRSPGPGRRGRAFTTAAEWRA